jgi:hypothetical protein
MKLKCAMGHILSRSGVIASIAAAEVTVIASVAAAEVTIIASVAAAEVTVIASVAAAEVTVTNNNYIGTSSINISFEALQLQRSCGP